MNLIQRLTGSSRFLFCIIAVGLIAGAEIAGRALSKDTIDLILYILGIFVAGETIRPAGVGAVGIIDKILGKKDEPTKPV